MTTPNTAPATHTTHPPAPGPIVVLASPDQVHTLYRDLRSAAAHHDDTAWLHPAPMGEREPIPGLSQDLLDALGVVGLAPPRTTGDSHLLRPLAHMVHGPTRHLLIDDATILPAPLLIELHDITTVAGIQLWLLLDPADRPSSRGTGLTRDAHVADILDWVSAAGQLEPEQTVRAWWTNRPNEHPDCPNPTARWWHTPLTGLEPLPRPCPHHAASRVACLLAQMRRALTAGRLSPTAARDRLTDYMTHPACTVTDRWRLTDAGRDLYTAGLDALRRTHPAAETATLNQVGPDGSTITIDGKPLDVPHHARPAVARLRTSRMAAGCLPSEHLVGLFDTRPGLPHRR